MTLDQLHQQTTTLKAEIRLLEKKKQEVSQEIQRFTRIHEEQVSDSTQKTALIESQIRLLERRKYDLEENISHLIATKQLQNTDKLTITSSEGDTRILEKRQNDLLQEVNRLDDAKKIEYTRFNKEIAYLKGRRDSLLSQIETLKDKTFKYEQTHASLQTDAREMVEKAKSESKKELDGMRFALKGMKERILKNNAESEELLHEAKEKQNNIENREKQFLQDRQAFYKEMAIYKTEKAQYDLEEDERRRLLQLLDNEEGEYKSRLSLLQFDYSHLGEKVMKLKQFIIDATHSHEEKEAQFEQKRIALENNEIAFAKREEELQKEQIVLKDRRETLERAIAEFRQKGINI